MGEGGAGVYVRQWVREGGIWEEGVGGGEGGRDTTFR